MNQSPEISIITVNYNGFQDTKELIDSLLEHIRRCSYEVIVVDNGSRHNEAILLQQAYPQIRTIRSEANLGFAGGNNLGINAAQGKYIFLLNNDTFIAEDSFVFLKERLESTPDCGAVGPKIRFAYPPRHIQFAGFTPFSKYTLRNRAIGFDEPDRGQYDNAHAIPFLHGAAMLIKREVIEKIGKMPENYFLYYEELDWCTQMTNAGYSLWYEPRTTVFHKESCTTGKNSTLKTFYLTRNRLLYTWRNRRGHQLFGSLAYQLFIAVPKNIVCFLCMGKPMQAKAVISGCCAFFKLKNKRN